MRLSFLWVGCCIFFYFVIGYFFNIGFVGQLIFQHLIFYPAPRCIDTIFFLMAKYIIYLRGLDPKYYTKENKNIKTPQRETPSTHKHAETPNNISSKNQHHQQWSIKHSIMILLQTFSFDHHSSYCLLEETTQKPKRTRVTN